MGMCCNLMKGCKPYPWFCLPLAFLGRLLSLTGGPVSPCSFLLKDAKLSPGPLANFKLQHNGIHLFLKFKFFHQK